MGGSKTGLHFAGNDLYLYDGDGNEVLRFDCTHRKLVVPTGTTLQLDSGSVTAIADKSIEAGDLALADGKILIGGSDGVAAAQTPLGDVTFTNAGATAIGSGKVTAGMLANGSGVAALVAAGLGASAVYPKTTTGAQTLLASNAAARVVLLVAYLASFSFTHIVSAWETMIFVVVTMILVPATLRWHWWRFSARALVYSMAATAAFIIFQKAALPNVSMVQSLGVNIAASLVISLTIGFLTKPPEMDVLVAFYAHVNPFGLWKPVRDVTSHLIWTRPTSFWCPRFRCFWR